MSDHAFKSSPIEVMCGVPNQFGRACGMFPEEHSEPAGPSVTTLPNKSQQWSAVGGEQVTVWQAADLGEELNWKWMASYGDRVVGRGANFRHRSQARHTAMLMFPPVETGGTVNMLDEVLTEIAIAGVPDEDVAQQILQGLQERGWAITPRPRATRYPKES